MSLFQSKLDYFLKGEDQLDVFHLGAHGCDVMFSSYDKDTSFLCTTNTNQFKGRLISGKLVLTLGNEKHRYQSGDWFEIPAKTQFSLQYITDCDIIEFWFMNQ
jgi:hypothetical protein